MNRDKFVFAQLVSFLDRNKFNVIVRKYDGDKYVKHFTCWNQLLALMFGQLCGRDSLRDLIIALDAHHAKCYHLGLGKNVSKSSLASANQTRDCRIFEEYAYYLVKQAQIRHATEIFKLAGKVYAFDSTTISLCLNVFWWAKYRNGKGGVKIHTLYDVDTHIPTFFHITQGSVNDAAVMGEIPYQTDAYYVFDRGYNAFESLYRIHSIGSYFVVRGKNNLQFKTTNIVSELPENILSDTTGRFTHHLSKKRYPDLIRKIVFWDQEQQREFTFLTNATHLDAIQIADIYKSRWQIELFFKWLKQHLQLKKFWGVSENAVRIQIYSAICAYCLVAIITNDLKLDRSTYEVLQVLSISLTDKTLLKDLFCKSKLQYNNEPTNLNELNLFKCT